MDLFTLVARLTLDEKDYEKALKQAERKSKNANLDSSGNIRANDQYSATLQRAEQQARNADLTAQGRVSVDTSGLASDIRDAERTVSDADLDADGEAAMDTSGLESDVDEAEVIADDADLDAEGESALDNSGLGGDVSEAEAIVDGGDYDGEGEITLDLSGLEQSVGEAKDSIGEVSTSIESASNQSSEFGTTFAGVIDSLESKLRAAGIVAAIGGITTAFRNAIHTSANYADEVDKTSQALRMSAHDYQVWEYVLGQSGASMSLVTRAWDNMDDAASGIDWTGITDAMGNAFDPSNYDNPADLFTGMMEALAGLEDEGRRADILEAVFGPRGRQFNAFLNGGIEGLEQLKQEAEDLGLIMSDEDIANGVAFGDAISRMDAALSGLRNRITGEIIPYLTEAVDLITRILTGQVEDGEIESTVSRIVTGLTSHATELITALVNALSVAVPALVNTLVSIVQDSNFQAAVFRLVKTVYDAIKEGLSNLVVTYVSGGRYNSYGEIENELIREAINQAGGTTDERREAAAQVIVGEAGARPGVIGDWSAMMTALGFDRGTFNATEGDVTRYLSDSYRTLANAETTDQEYYATLLGLKEFQDSINAGMDHSEAVQAAQAKQADAMSQTVDTLYRLLTGGTLDRSGYNAVWRAYQLPEDQQSTRHGSRVTTSSGEIYIPEGDTEAGWKAFANILEAYLGRPVTNNELQQLIDRGFHLDDAFEASVANMNLDAATVTIDGATINYTINGRVVAQNNLDAFSPYGDMLNGSDGSHAKGLWSVPYDDYLANLHRDEMVLTASQAREYRDGDGENAAIVGAIQELRNDMANLRIFVGERAFGQTVVDYSGRRLRGYMGQAEDRQFAGYGWG